MFSLGSLALTSILLSNSALKDAQTRCEQTLASCRKLVKASSVAILAEHKMVLDSINSLCSQVDTQPLRPLMQPAIRCIIPPASDILAGILCRINVSLCGEEEKREETRENEEDEKLGETSGEYLSVVCTSRETACAGGNQSQQPVRWPFEKCPDLPPSVNRHHKLEPLSFVCEASDSEEEQAQECSDPTAAVYQEPHMLEVATANDDDF